MAQRADYVNLVAVIPDLECDIDALIQLKSFDNFFSMVDSSLMLFHEQSFLCLAHEYRGRGKRACLYNMLCSKSPSKVLVCFFFLPLRSEYFSSST